MTSKKTSKEMSKRKKEMSIKFENPPVVYAVAKLIYKESIGSFGEDKYQELLASLKRIGFDSYTKSKLTGIQFKQSDNKFTATQSSTDRVGYYSPDRKLCALLDDNAVELRITNYSNHSVFLDTFRSFIEILHSNSIANANDPHEIEINYVDLFAPKECTLQQMFKNIKLPIPEFYSLDSDLFKVGVIHFTRVLECGTKKVSINLEQHLTKDVSSIKKFIPDSLTEPDGKLSLKFDTQRLFTDVNLTEYAIVHTSSSSLVNSENQSLDNIRNTLEELYLECKKTFDEMINLEVCDGIWMRLNKR